MFLFAYLNELNVRRSGNRKVRVGALRCLLRLFAFKSFIGWFLSEGLGGHDMEECADTLLPVIDLSISTGGLEFKHDLERITEDRKRLSQICIHRHGVTLLAPKSEKLHFTCAGHKICSCHCDPSLFDSLTPEQEQHWLDAFKTLADNLRCVFMSDSRSGIVRILIY